MDKEKDHYYWAFELPKFPGKYIIRTKSQMGNEKHLEASFNGKTFDISNQDFVAYLRKIVKPFEAPPSSPTATSEEYVKAENILIAKEVPHFDWMRMKGTTPGVYQAIIEAMTEYASLKEQEARRKAIQECQDLMSGAFHTHESEFINKKLEKLKK